MEEVKMDTLIYMWNCERIIIVLQIKNNLKVKK